MLRSGDLPSGLPLFPPALGASFSDCRVHTDLPIALAQSFYVSRSLHLASNPILLSGSSKINRPEALDNNYRTIDPSLENQAAADPKRVLWLLLHCSEDVKVNVK